MENQAQQQTKIFSLFNASGKMEEITPATLPINCKLYFFSAGMASSEGAIISEPDAYGNQKAVKFSSSEDGRPMFYRVDKYSRPISKKFGIGIYYSDNHETHPAELVQEYIKKAEEAEKARAAAAQAEEIRSRQELESLPGLFPHLTPLNKGGKDADNLRAELKKAFPGVKFSVKKEHYSTYYVRWTDGPSREEVEKITGKFEDHETDQLTGDFRDYAPSNFNRVFGGFKYVFESRQLSDEIRAIIGESKELYRSWCAQSFPVGAHSFSVKDSAIFYEVSAPAEPIQAINAEGVQIVDYSEKAVAVIGDTKEIKDVLKSLGGRFNPRLTCGAGWIFPKTKQDQVKKALNIQ